MKNRKNIPGFISSMEINAFFLMVQPVLNSLMGIVFWKLATSLYLPSSIGISNALIASATMVAMFAQMGFNISLVRFLKETPHKNLLVNSSFVLTNIIGFILGIFFILGISLWLPVAEFIKTQIWSALIFVVLSVASLQYSLIGSLIVQERKSQHMIYRDLLMGITKIATLPLFLWAGQMGVFLAWGTGTLIAVAYINFLKKRFLQWFKPQIRIKWSLIRSLFRYSISNYFIVIFEWTPALVMPLLIASTRSPEESAYFALALLIGSRVLDTIPSALATSLLAEGSNAPESSRYLFNRLLRILVPITALWIVIIIAAPLILSFFGKEYADGGSLFLRIYALSWPFYTFKEFYRTSKQLSKKLDQVLIIAFIGAALSISVSVILVNYYGIIGVGIGFLLGRFCAALIASIIEWKIMTEYFFKVVPKMKTYLSFVGKIFHIN